MGTDYNNAQEDLATLHATRKLLEQLVNKTLNKLHSDKAVPSDQFGEDLEAFLERFDEAFHAVEKECRNTIEREDLRTGQQETHDIDCTHRAYVGQP